MHTLVPLLSDGWVNELRWLKKMLVGQAKLKRGLQSIHSSGASAEAWARQTVYLQRFGAIVTMNCRESRPHREVNMIGALNVHWHSHRRRVSDKRMRCVIRWHNQTSAHGLFAKVIGVKTS